jgi:hypothetical protein
VPLQAIREPLTADAVASASIVAAAAGKNLHEAV